MFKLTKDNCDFFKLNYDDTVKFLDEVGEKGKLCPLFEYPGFSTDDIDTIIDKYATAIRDKNVDKLMAVVQVVDAYIRRFQKNEPIYYNNIRKHINEIYALRCYSHLYGERYIDMIILHMLEWKGMNETTDNRLKLFEMCLYIPKKYIPSMGIDLFEHFVYYITSMYEYATSASKYKRINNLAGQVFNLFVTFATNKSLSDYSLLRMIPWPKDIIKYSHNALEIICRNYEQGTAFNDHMFNIFDHIDHKSSADLIDALFYSYSCQIKNIGEYSFTWFKQSRYGLYKYLPPYLIRKMSERFYASDFGSWSKGEDKKLFAMAAVAVWHNKFKKMSGYEKDNSANQIASLIMSIDDNLLLDLISADTASMNFTPVAAKAISQIGSSPVISSFPLKIESLIPIISIKDENIPIIKLDSVYSIMANLHSYISTDEMMNLVNICNKDRYSFNEFYDRIVLLENIFVDSLFLLSGNVTTIKFDSSSVNWTKYSTSFLRKMKDLDLFNYREFGLMRIIYFIDNIDEIYKAFEDNIFDNTEMDEILDRYKVIAYNAFN